MASEQKAFASLSSGLLARKGAARPAMRPQGFGQMGNGLDDLGWNDMGFEPPKPTAVPVRDEEHDAFGEEVPVQPLRNPLAALTPVQSPVHDQQATIADRFTTPDDASEEGEEFDETAEIYDPEEADAAAPLELQPSDEMAAPEVPSAPIMLHAVPDRVPEPAPAAVKRRVRQSKVTARTGKAAFTLRLDPDRHLKLRLACAVDGRSAQQIVTDALDQFLAGMPELDAMATKAKR